MKTCAWINIKHFRWKIQTWTDKWRHINNSSLWYSPHPFLFHGRIIPKFETERGELKQRNKKLKYQRQCASNSPLILRFMSVLKWMHRPLWGNFNWKYTSDDYKVKWQIIRSWNFQPGYNFGDWKEFHLGYIFNCFFHFKASSDGNVLLALLEEFWCHGIIYCGNKRIRNELLKGYNWNRFAFEY